MSLSNKIHRMYRSQYDFKIRGFVVTFNFEVLSTTIVHVVVTRDDSSRGKVKHLIQTNLINEMRKYFIDNTQFIRLKGKTKETLYLEAHANNFFKYFLHKGLRDLVASTEVDMLRSILARTVNCDVDQVEYVSSRTFREIDHLTCCLLTLDMINNKER